MKIFLDTLDLKQIERFKKIIFGVTVNSKSFKRFDVSDEADIVERIANIDPKFEIHIEAFGTSKEEIEDNIKRIRAKLKDIKIEVPSDMMDGSTKLVSPKIIFKIPFSEAAVNISWWDVGMSSVSMGLIYSVNQALLAANAGAEYVCPLVGKLDDAGHNAIKKIKKIKESFGKQGAKTQIMVSSVRNPTHVMNAYEIGVDAITIPPDVLIKMFTHPMTDVGIKIFKEDLADLRAISDLSINRSLIVPDSTTLRACMRKMAEYKGGAVVVTNEAGTTLHGIFTLGDMKRLLCLDDFDNMNAKVGDLIKGDCITVDSSETVSKAKDLFKSYKIEQLVVVNSDDSIVGILEATQVL